MEGEEELLDLELGARCVVHSHLTAGLIAAGFLNDLGAPV